jgi:hypothetical protein
MPSGLRASGVKTWSFQSHRAGFHARSDEPDLYLVTVTESIVSAADGQERMQEYMAWRKKTLEQMVSESGNRAEYREVMSESLLQVLSFRD